jgi:hypothetical protein
VGLKSLKSLNLTNGYPNKNKNNKNNNNNNKVKSKPLELFELAGKNLVKFIFGVRWPNFYIKYIVMVWFIILFVPPILQQIQISVDQPYAGPAACCCGIVGIK